MLDATVPVSRSREVAPRSKFRAERAKPPWHDDDTEYYEGKTDYADCADDQECYEEQFSGEQQLYEEAEYIGDEQVKYGPDTTPCRGEYRWASPAYSAPYSDSAAAQSSTGHKYVPHEAVPWTS